MQIAAAMQNLRDEHDATLRGIKDEQHALATELKAFMTDMSYKVSQVVAPGSAPPELLGVPMGPSRPPPPAAAVGTSQPPPPAAAVGPSQPPPPAAAMGSSRPPPPAAAVGSRQPDMNSVLKFPSTTSVALAVSHLRDQSAAEFYVECVRDRSGNPPSNLSSRQARQKAKLCLDWFNSMASEEGKKGVCSGR